MKKRKPIDGGEPCPKCRRKMQRYKHRADWHPKAGQPYYFAYWDQCKRCRHLQHYEIAKITLAPEASL